MLSTKLSNKGTKANKMDTVLAVLVYLRLVLVYQKIQTNT